MSSESGSNVSEKAVEVVFVAEEQSSGEEPPMSEWSSLEIELPEENRKKYLFSKDLYTPGSGEICVKYIPMSDSDVFRHLYYNYPAVRDPGIKDALLAPERPIVFDDDGQDLYLATCLEMSVSPVMMFHKNLLSNEINLNYYCVQSKGIRAMALALQYNKFVQKLSLVDNFLNDDACYHLGQMLKVNDTLNELNLSGCRVGASGILRLINNLQENKTLEVLDISRNNMKDEGGLHLAKKFVIGIRVKRLNLSKNALGRETALAFADALGYTNRITHLDLSWNNFFNIPSLVKMLEELANSKTLQELNLAWNSLEGDRIGKVIKEIILVPSLTVLKLNNNRLCDEAIQSIVTNLFKAKKLNTLDLSFNPLTARDACVVLEKMLKPRVKIVNLLMNGVWVDKNFVTILDQVNKMKSRKNFKVEYDGVLSNYTISNPDERDIIMKRAEFLGRQNKKNLVDIPLYFLALNKEFGGRLLGAKEFQDRVSYDKVPLNDELTGGMISVFAGPKGGKEPRIDLELLCDYVHRLWPDKKLPPTPPPEPEPEPLPPPPPPPKEKGKKGKK